MRRLFLLLIAICFIALPKSYADNFSGPLENDTIIQLTPDGVEVIADESPSGEDGKLLVVLGDKVFFVAQDETHGQELWMSDGTIDGTQVIDVWVGDSSSAPNNLTVSNNKVFFSAYTAEKGRELYWSDGTTTQMVYDLYEGANSSSPEFLTDFNGKLLFKAEDSYSEERKLLWITDGTEENTEFIGSVEPQAMKDSKIKHIQVAGDKAFFAGDDGFYGTELWVTDGTFDNTHMILDITFDTVPGGEEGSTLPTWLEWFYAMDNGDLVFRAQTPAFWLGKDDTYKSTHNNLWISDGTAAGTYCITDLNPDPDPNDSTSTKNSGAAMYAEYAGNLIFRAEDPIAHNEPWITDGTANNTELFYDINGVKEGDGKNKPSWFDHPFVFDGLLFFGAAVNQNFENSTYLPMVGKELWATDMDSVYLVKDIFEGTSTSSKPKYLMACNNRMYFQANDANNNSNIELWACEPRDGEGNFNVYKVFDEIDNGKPIQLKDLGGNLVFATLGTKKLYKYDDGETKVTMAEDAQAYGPASTGLKNPYIDKYQSEIGDTADYHPEVVIVNSINNKAASNNIDIYPNPASNMLNINVDMDNVTVKIYNITGSIAWEGIIARRGKIDISSLNPGIYMLTAESDENQIQYSKLIIE